MRCRSIFHFYVSFFLLCISANGQKEISAPINTSPFTGRSYLTNTNDINNNIAILQKDIEDYLQKKDTASAITRLLLLSDLFANNAQYGKSYDGYWRALLLADQTKDTASKAQTYHGLGWLYSLYKREEKAIEYFNLSLAINKRQIDKYNLNKDQLVRDYYALVTLYRKEGKTKQARLYIDSCRQAQINENDASRNAYLNAEEGYLFYLENKYQAAIERLDAAKDFFEQSNDPSFLVILYSFYGDVYKATKEYDKGISFYQDALKTIDKTRMHLDMEPEIYNSMADAYQLKGDYASAYKMLLEAKRVTEQQFGSRSTNNKELLEIKDDYRIAKEKQKLEQLENEKKISNLKATIYAGSMVFLLILGVILFRYLRTRHRVEKALMRKKQELEMNKAKEILEIKNKELTASTLRIIEKDEILSDLKEKLKDQRRNPDADELNKIMKSIDANNANNWEEFEASFSSVNKSFYHHLAEKFPELTHNDKKICALVKLNFSSKDMSRLLGISIESVHTTRYRLRKKLNLHRDVNLVDFIQQI